MHVGIIGLGAMGTSLSRALHAGALSSQVGAPTAGVAASGVRLVAVSSRRSGVAESLARELTGVTAVSPAAMAAHVDLVLLTVGDSELATVASNPAFGPGITVVHTSGALDLSVLQPAANRGAGVGSFHPMLSVPRVPAGAVQFDGAVVAVDAGSGMLTNGDVAAERSREGDRTVKALVHAQLTGLAEALGMVPLTVTADYRARWHAAATLVGNSSAALMAHADHMLRDLPGEVSVRRAALVGLMRSVVQNLSALPSEAPLQSAISGPIARGNAPIVARHLAALNTAQDREAYRHAASLVWLAVADQLPQESRDALARLLAPVDLT